MVALGLGLKMNCSRCCGRLGELAGLFDHLECLALWCIGGLCFPPVAQEAAAAAEVEGLGEQRPRR